MFGLRTLSIGLGIVIGLAAAACGSGADSIGGGQSDLTEAPNSVKTPAEAVPRILELAPDGTYRGTTPEGDECSLTVEALDADDVSIRIASSSCPECMNLRQKTISFRIHPEVRFDMGSPATLIPKWDDKNASLDFSIMDDDANDIAMSITDVAKANASVSATITGSSGQGFSMTCANLKAE